MERERNEVMPILPQNEVRLVVEKRYMFASVVKGLVGNIRTESGRLIDMSAIRDALLAQTDQMVQDDEANRFACNNDAVHSTSSLQAANLLVSKSAERCMAFVQQ